MAGFTNIAPFPYQMGNLTNVVPFTYREGYSFLEILEDIRTWLNNVAVPDFNKAIDNAIEEYKKGIANAEATVIATKEEWNSLFEAFMANLEAELIKLNDESLQAILGNPVSLTRVKLGQLYTGIVRGDSLRNLDEFSGANDSAKLANAIATLRPHGDVVLQVTRDLVITEPMKIDLDFMSVDFNGHTVTSQVFNGPAIEFVNGNAVITALNRRFVKNLELVGPTKAYPESIGFMYRSTDVAKVKTVRGLALENVEISYFARGEVYGGNSFLVTHINGHTYQCGTNMHILDKEDATYPGNVNYGENYRYLAWGFGSSDLGIYQGNNTLTDTNFIACSFDFLKKLAHVVYGQVNFSACHFEFEGELPAPVIYVGSDTSAKVVINTGRIQYNAGGARPETWFESHNEYWGGGLVMTDVHLHAIFSASKILCGGKGTFRTRGMTTPSGTNGSGFASSDLISSASMNLLIDPTFSIAANVDAIIFTGANVTAPNVSNDIEITNVGNRMIFNKKTAGQPCEVIFAFRVEHGKTYAHCFTLDSYNSGANPPGSLRSQEQFAAIKYSDINGKPTILRTFSRGEVQWDISTLPGVRKAFGAGPWNREAPTWATHYLVRFPLTNIAIGTYSFKELIATAL